MKLLRKKPIELLRKIKQEEPAIIQRLARNNDKCPNEPHAVKLVKEFERYGLVERTKKGRTKYTRLTEDGKEVLKKIEKVSQKWNKLNK